MEQFKEAVITFWNWLDHPLPIVGVSLSFILIFIWKIFSSTSFGKKQIKRINEGFARLKEETDLTEKRVDEKIKELENYKAKIDEKLKYYESIIIELCNTLPNKKVKAIAERVKRYEEEERTDNQATSE